MHSPLSPLASPVAESRALLRRALAAKEHDLALAAEYGMQLSVENEQLSAKFDSMCADLENQRTSALASERRAQRTIAELLEKQQQLEAALEAAAASAAASTVAPSHAAVATPMLPSPTSSTSSLSSPMSISLGAALASSSMRSESLSASPHSIDSSFGGCDDDEMRFRRLSVGVAQFPATPASAHHHHHHQHQHPQQQQQQQQQHHYSVLKMRLSSAQEDLESSESARATLQCELADAHARLAQLTAALDEAARAAASNTPTTACQATQTDPTLSIARCSISTQSSPILLTLPPLPPSPIIIAAAASVASMCTEALAPHSARSLLAELSDEQDDDDDGDDSSIREGVRYRRNVLPPLEAASSGASGADAASAPCTQRSGRTNWCATVSACWRR